MAKVKKQRPETSKNLTLNPHVIHLNFFIYILFALSILYAVLILSYLISWSLLKKESVDLEYAPKTKVSILIPCRNEAKNILAILYDLSFQIYSKDLFEVIVLDDFSSDQTVELAKTAEGELSVRVFKLSDHIQESESSKKAALTFGVNQALGELIITVDADCRMHSNWLRSMVQFYEGSDKKIFSAPILYDPVEGWLPTFEALDVAGMMIITGGMHRSNLGLLCNGGNLAFEKRAFEAVNGYEGKNHMVSGDDVFLMEKVESQFPGSAGFLKNEQAIVRTAPEGSWKKFMNQRTRWASKNHQYTSWKLPIQLAIPVLFSWCIVVGLILAVAGVIAFHYLWMPLILKVVSDFILQLNATIFFKRTKWLVFFPIAEILHIIYLMMVSINALIGRFTWKNRAY